MSNRFLHEDEIEAAYDAAEMILESYLDRELLLVDERARRQTLGKVSRAIADAVIRSSPIEYADISSVPGVSVERVRVGSDG